MMIDYFVFFNKIMALHVLLHVKSALMIGRRREEIIKLELLLKNIFFLFCGTGGLNSRVYMLSHSTSPFL
jgi:hypothetical protein